MRTFLVVLVLGILCNTVSCSKENIGNAEYLYTAATEGDNGSEDDQPDN